MNDGSVLLDRDEELKWRKMWFINDFPKKTVLQQLSPVIGQNTIANLVKEMLTFSKNTSTPRVALQSHRCSRDETDLLLPRTRR